MKATAAEWLPPSCPILSFHSDLFPNDEGHPRPHALTALRDLTPHPSSLKAHHSSPSICVSTPADPCIPWCVTAPSVGSYSGFHGQNTSGHVSDLKQNAKPWVCISRRMVLGFHKILKGVWIPDLRTELWVCFVLGSGYLNVLFPFRVVSHGEQLWRPPLRHHLFFCFMSLSSHPRGSTCLVLSQLGFLTCLHTCWPYWPLSSWG